MAALAVDGRQTREHGHTSRSNLDELETVMGFNLYDWWQPTAENYFSRIGKPQICEAMREAGRSGKARDAEKMKKGDAAALAADELAELQWLPGWMTPVTEKKEAEQTPGDSAA